MLLEVARLHFYCMGHRGDWKALVALFNMKRNYSTNQAIISLFYVRVWGERLLAS